MYQGWRVRPPAFAPEADERAALSLLTSSPQAAVAAADLDESATASPPPPPPPPLWASIPRQHLIRVERATWKASFRSQPLPFVPMEVQEARSVTARALRRWTHTRVRLVGVVQHDLVPWLVSVGVAGKPNRVALDLTVIAVAPPFDRLIEVFGTLDVDDDTSIPQVQVTFFRKLQREYLKRYYKAQELQKPFIPLFIEKLDRNRQKRLHSDSSEEGDIEAAILNPCTMKLPVH